MAFQTKPPAKAHHFFKIISAEIILDSKMIIPKTFVRKYGKELADEVFLKAPNGAFWQVNLESRNGEVWLQNGWKELANHYSIQFGHVIVFRHEGNSVFHVSIFDKTTTEIEYPVSGEQFNRNERFQEGKKRVSVHENLDASSAKRVKAKSEEKTTNPSFCAHFVATRSALNIPKCILRKQGIKLKPAMRLRDPRGKVWPVEWIRRCDGRIHLIKLAPFIKENKVNIKEDKLIFEFVLDERRVCEEFKVQISRV